MKLLLQVQTAQGAPEALAGLCRLEARWKGQSPCNHGRQGPASPVAGLNRAAGVGGADDTGADAVSRECGQTHSMWLHPAVPWTPGPLCQPPTVTCKAVHIL